MEISSGGIFHPASKCSLPTIYNQHKPLHEDQPFHGVSPLRPAFCKLQPEQMHRPPPQITKIVAKARLKGYI
jgi:hypothetical protein